METKVIDWDGANLPEALKSLPPGQYAIESLDRVESLTEQEDSGIAAGLAELDAGKGMSLADVVREVRIRKPRG